MKCLVNIIAKSTIIILFQSGVYAQEIGFLNPERNQPIEIDADNSIEWHQEAQAYIARGNAKAKQGDVVVYADLLTAFYKKLKKGGTKIWRINADGNVRIVSPDKTAFGEKGVYDVGKALFVLTGKPRLETRTERISASKSMEFWGKKSVAVARGNAIAIKGDKRLQARVLTAYFEKTHKSNNEITRVNAYDDVVVSSPKEVIRGKIGTYNVKTGIIILRGGVKITRGPDQLNGNKAEVNLNTGVSRLLSGGGKKVQGLFGPKNLRPDVKQRNLK